MGTTTETRAFKAASLGHCVALRDIGWKGYTTMLRLRGERPGPRMTYLDGTLYLMSPSYTHERLKERLGIFVVEVVVGLNIPCAFSGQTTFRRRSGKGGAEPDQSYYLANEERIRGKEEIDLRTDPPPDLAIEAVNTHEAWASVAVFRRLRVPEIWVFDDSRFRILVRQANGRYSEAERSAAFPFLSAAEIADWIHRPSTGSETDWVKELRRWVRETLVPRHRERNG